MLTDYPDLQLVDHLEFGWPLDYSAQCKPRSTKRNHASAADIKDHVVPFVAEECELGALIGPLENLPFSLRCQLSPLMTRLKKNSLAKRIIMDLSFPLGVSVNAGIRRGFYQGSPFSFTLPTIATLLIVYLNWVVTHSCGVQISQGHTGN